MFHIKETTSKQFWNHLKSIPQRWMHQRKTKKQLNLIRYDPYFLNPILSDEYRKDLSYRYSWRSFQHESILKEYMFVSDAQFGGSSTGNITYNGVDRCMDIKGRISDKDKQKMIYYPSIGAMPYGVFEVQLGQFNVLGVEIKSDGYPIQIQLGLITQRYGQISAYGLIVSKKNTFQRYELPLINMVIRGAQKEHRNALFRLNTNLQNMTISNRDLQNLRIITKTDMRKHSLMTLTALNIRLHSSVNTDRHVSIKNIDFVHRAGYDRLIEEYRPPYFYIIPKEKEQQHPTHPSITMLQRSYDQFPIIDYGDKIYYRKT